ncbi:MAG: sugar phosphate isomerase/epimerase [Planctomycetota bacterium]
MIQANSKTAPDCTRRSFLGSLAAAAPATLALSSRAFSHEAKPEIKLGFDNFSIRGFNYDAPQLIDYAKSLNVDVLLLSDLDVYESFADDYLEGVRQRAAQAGLELHVGTGSICPTSTSYNQDKWGEAEDHVRLLVRTARRLGSSVARCYLGNRRDRSGEGGIYRHIDETVKVLKSVQSEAEDANVKIAVENHAGDMQAWELVELIEAAGRGFVGATMDSGNALWTIEDPMVNLETLGPYALTTGLRDTAVWETDDGAACMWANMGQGAVDWHAYLARYRELCPQTPFVLEIISYKWANQAPYLKPEFWSKFPEARAREFARFVGLAKRGKEFEIPAGRPNGQESAELEQAQQKFDLEESLAYCREVLGIGRKT